MVNYRRNFIPGGTYFFTLTLKSRRKQLLTEHIDLLKQALRSVKQRYPLRIEAIVVLPEHLHTIWTLPDNDTNYPRRIRDLKSHFCQGLNRIGVAFPCNPKGDYNIWQARYWEHTICDEYDLRAHIDYIHYNPVKHGYVAKVSEWPYSSFHQYVREGVLEEDWGGKILNNISGKFGE